MRIALIADIHGNLPALEAGLKAIRAHAPDMIVSLGDQVNLGPNPREVLALLDDAGVKCLHGNHERYILTVMAGKPGYEGANFDSLRFNAALLTAQQITFPETLQIDGITLCHAMPGDDRFPVYDREKAVPLLRSMKDAVPRHIICGHGHDSAQLRMDDILIECIGSLGCMDSGVPGVAPYAILDTGKDYAYLSRYNVAYDTRRLRPLFKSTGMADYCPVMARIACTQMEKNIDCLVPFVTMAGKLAAERGESVISESVWNLTQERYPWPDGKTLSEFWA